MLYNNGLYVCESKIIVPFLGCTLFEIPWENKNMEWEHNMMHDFFTRSLV